MDAPRNCPVDDRKYDLFEIFPDGSPLWLDVVSGREKAVLKLRELSAQTANEVRMMHLPTNTVVAAKRGEKSSS
jgi:hypothetical protein